MQIYQSQEFGSILASNDVGKGRPEPLENEIDEILCSKREDQFSDSFFLDLVQNTSSVRCSYLFRLNNFIEAPWNMQIFSQKGVMIARY